jgi:uncharacterized membrane protein
MAELLHVYRRFYRVSTSDGAAPTYTLIDPTTLTASVRNISQGNVVVESTASTVNTSVGVYYADLSVDLYNSDDEYEIDWQVEYTSSAPVRHLYTRFRFPYRTISVGRVVRELDVEVSNPMVLSVELDGNTLDYTIEPANP